MIAYHTCWDLTHLFDASWDWFFGLLGFVWQQSICWTFLLLSGFCWGMSRHAPRRGLTVFAAGGAVSAVTYLAEPEEPVFFGVLTLLGTAMLLLSVVRPLLWRMPRGVGFALSAGLFVLFRSAKDGYLGFCAWHIRALPSFLYRNLLTACLGFPPDGFYSSDYFPLFPWLFLFATGFFLYRIWQEHGSPRAELPLPRTPVHAAGRHSLGLYLVHQPLIMALLTVIF